MTEIRDDDMVWAVVERLGEMLDKPNGPHEVTHTLSVFSSILLWTTQSLRDPAKLQAKTFVETQLGPCYKFVQQTLPKSRIDWSAPNNASSFSTFRVIVMLRDAIAHGDEQRVFPMEYRGKLTGYRFVLYKDKNDADARKKTGEASIVREDMVQLGRKISKEFCQALKPVDDAAICAARAAII